MIRVLSYVVLTCICLILLIEGCNNQEEIVPYQELYFPVENIDSLKLDKLENYWGTDSLFTIDRNNQILIYNQLYAYLGGIWLHQNNKTIVFTVFKNRDTALDALNYYFDATLYNFYTETDNYYIHSNTEGVSIIMVEHNTIVEMTLTPTGQGLFIPDEVVDWVLQPLDEISKRINEFSLNVTTN